MVKRTLTDYLQDRIDLYESLALHSRARDNGDMVLLYTTILDELDRLIFIIKLECEEGENKKC